MHFNAQLFELFIFYCKSVIFFHICSNSHEMDPQREKEIGNNCGILLCTKGTSYLIDEYDCSMVMLTHKNVSHYLRTYNNVMNAMSTTKYKCKYVRIIGYFLNVWRRKKK